VFRESRGRWVSLLQFYDDTDSRNILYPTCYEWAGSRFFSWLDESANVWAHSDDLATPLEIYGQAKTAYVSVWGNAQPNMIKVFDSISLHTDSALWAGLVYIPESINHPDGMESALPQASFKRREGVLHAPYLFNALTADGTFRPEYLYRGESLRGYIIHNLLYTSAEARLFKVDVNFRTSNI
ncbi:MAG: hypothetical protein JXM68_00075, partial [Sedimentisphaerales bacterium]|nr:hypothetical protein [Sedimentisphaerales bacterium]